MKKLKIKRKKYADGTLAVGVMGDEDMDASNLRGDDLAAWNAAGTQAEKDAIVANAKQGLNSKGKLAGLAPALSTAGAVIDTIAPAPTEVDGTKRSSVGATTLSRAGQFASIGAIGGPIGAGIGAGVGAIEGLIEGFVNKNKADKKEKEFNRNKNIANSVSAANDVNYVPRMKEGGEVEGAGGPKDDKINMSLPERSFVVPVENADKAEALRKKHLGKTTKKMKSGGDVPVKLSDGEHVFTPEERDVLESQGVDLSALAPNAQEDDFNFKMGGSVPKGYAPGGEVVLPETPVIGEGELPLSQRFAIGKYPGIDTQETMKKAAQELSDKEVAAEKAALEEQLGKTLSEEELMQLKYKKIFENAVPATQEELDAKNDTETKKKLLNVSDALGGATGALALAQVGLGLSQTLSGKRPKFKVDSEFLGRLSDALKSEKSGLPEATKTAALNKLDLGRKALTNYATSISGGNTGTAFAAAKEAAGQEAADIVELASKDAMMKLQKKSRTDALVSHLQGLKQFEFQNDMNAFMQNQQAGAQLTQAGISNFVGNKQYKDAQDRMDARLAKYGTTGLTTPTT